MAVRPDPTLNFINALSDFWVVFFKDTTQIRAYFSGVEINVGQLYLELLETVLGPSLRHAPVFSKKYFKLFTVSEDATFYIEGAAPEDDRYLFEPADADLQAVGALMNRVVLPTAVLEDRRDYEIGQTGIEFYNNPFDVDGQGNSQPAFALRSVAKSFAADFRDPARRSFAAAGVKIGDFFRLKVGAGNPVFSRITGYADDSLYLQSSSPDFSQNLKSRAFKVSVLRVPFDARQNGVQLPDHPSEVQRLSNFSTDLATVPGTNNVDLSAEIYFKGAWAPFNIYAVGVIVIAPGPTLVRAIVTHTSGAVYSSAPWEPFLNKYLSVHLPTSPDQDGLFRVVSTAGAVITLDRPTPFVSTLSNRAQAWLVGYPNGLLGPGEKPTIQFQRQYIDPATFTLFAKRGQPVYVRQGGVYVEKPEGGLVEEGVDYLMDYDAGVMTVLSGWNPGVAPLAGYEWRIDVVTYAYAPATAWVAATAYVVGDQVTYNGNNYVCVTANADAVFTPGNWTLYTAPFTFNQIHDVKEIAMWGSEVLIDLQTLYTNFGYLLGYERPSSEQYRAFLQGVAQLFVIGPALARFESALNVTCNLPVVRDDGEVLQNYSNGIWASGNDGQILDATEGRNGTLVTSSSQFSSPTANFFPSDAGAVIRVKLGNSFASYTITAVLSATAATVTPVPPDSSSVIWGYSHVAFDRVFRSTSYAFSADDLDAILEISGATNAANNGRFRIASVENATTVILDSQFNLQDETSLDWRLSRSGVQTVTTSRTTYELPFQVKIKPAIAQSSNWNVLKFQAFDPLTDAFVVADYVQDPTWWHDTEIPKELLSFSSGSEARRRVSSLLVEHRVNPFDNAAVGDIGLAAGVDDEGRPGISRVGSAVWLGADQVALSFPAGVPVANAQDPGRYALVSSPLFEAQFEIRAVDTAGTTLSLNAFPPPELRGVVPPQPLTVELPPLLYRRTIGFVMMDRYFKYHALSVKIDSNTPLTPDFFTEAVGILQQTKPGFTYVYLNTPLGFRDEMLGVDQGVTLGVGLGLNEPVIAADNNIVVGPPGLVLANDTFYFLQQTQALGAAPGVYTLTPVLPVGGAPRFHVVKGWFDLAVTVGGRRLAENQDYVLDRLNGTVTLTATLPGPTTFTYVAVILRTRAPGDGLVDEPGETAICTNGSNPTTWWGAGQTYSDAGLIDRAVQLTIA